MSKRQTVTDLKEVFECVLKDMMWEEILSTVKEVISEMSGDTTISEPPPPSPPPPRGPAPGGNIRLQPTEVSSLGGGVVPLEEASCRFQQPGPSMAAPGSSVRKAVPIVYQGPDQTGNRYNQDGVYSQGQCNSVPVLRLPDGKGLKLFPVGFVSRIVVNGTPINVFTRYDSAAAAPPLNTSNTKRRKYYKQQGEDRPYIKKPPNAFMIFRKEQRPNVVAELNISNCAVVNKILGQRWKLLSLEEQAKYYKQAEKENLLHSQQYPNWSAAENYGRHRKRNSRKTPTSVQKSASAGVMEPSTCEPHKMEPSTCEPHKMEPSTFQAGVTEPSNSQTVLGQPPYNVIPETLPQRGTCHPPELYNCYWPGSPTTASTALGSPAAPSETQ